MPSNYTDTKVTDMIFNVLDSARYETLRSSGQLSDAQLYLITDDDILPSTTIPLMDGTASTGSEQAYARGDHRHPTDTSRAPLASPSFTGTPTAPTAAAGTNSTQIATTAFVNDAISSATPNIQAGDGLIKTTSGTTVTLSDHRGIEYIRGTWTAATNVWTGVSEDNELYEGKQILLFMPYAGTSTAATLNLTLANSTTTGAKNVYFEGTTRMTTHKAANSQIHLIYHEDHNISGTNYTGWWYVANRDTNTTNILNVPYSGYKLKAALYRYQLVFTINENYIVPVNSSSNNTNTGKTLTTESFDPFGEIYYYSTTTTINAEANTTSASFYSQYGLIDLRYSFNTAKTLTAYKAVYLVCVPQTDGLVKLHTTPISQDLPSTDDGLVYKYLGQAYDTYRITLMQNKPCYQYKGGCVRPYGSSGGATLTIGTYTYDGTTDVTIPVYSGSLSQ